MQALQIRVAQALLQILQSEKKTLSQMYPIVKQEFEDGNEMWYEEEVAE